MKTRKRQAGGLRPDKLGRYRSYIGQYAAADGVTRPHRFWFGTERAAADHRYHRIHALWSDNCRDGATVWATETLVYAKAIANGNEPQFSPVADNLKGHERRLLKPRQAIYGVSPKVLIAAKYSQQFEQTKAAMPSLAELAADPVLQSESIEANRQLIQAQLKQLQDELDRLGALSAANQKLPARLIPGTLHDTLDAYQKDFEANATRLPSGKLKQYDRKRGERVVKFKKTHPDLPLHDLTMTRIKEFASHWRNRPITETGERSSRAFAKHHLGELVRFLKWLDGSEQYRWEAPRGMAEIPRKIPKFEHEKKLTAVTKHVYSPEQLETIAATATDWERLALYLALNCAMGAAELGRLVVDDVILKTAHPFPSKLGITTTAEDSWLRYFRPKTEVFGEWCLWPETVELVDWAIKRAKKIGSKLLFCRTSGAPLFDDDSAKPDAGFANLWSRCRSRSKIKLELPFGSLRDTLPDYLRATYDGGTELASLCLTHGTPGIDELIDCYANRPFGRLHTAINASHDFFAPLWAVHKSPEPF